MKSTLHGPATPAAILTLALALSPIVFPVSAGAQQKAARPLPAPSTVYWCTPCLMYAGDYLPDDPNANQWFNANDPLTPDTFVSMPFIVGDHPMTIQGLFTNEILQNINTLYPKAATWSISTGVAPGQAGTVIASGGALVNSILLIGNFEYAIVASIPPVTLQPGIYWLTFVPQCTHNQVCSVANMWLTNTEGTNDVYNGPWGANGSPADLAYITSSTLGYDYMPLCDVNPTGCQELSFGLIGQQP